MGHRGEDLARGKRGVNSDRRKPADVGEKRGGGGRRVTGGKERKRIGSGKNCEEWRDGWMSRDRGEVDETEGGEG